MTIIRVGMILMFITTLLCADTIEDQDMDGVPDTIDQCPNSPFLTEVNSKGCATQELIFPQERDNGSLDLILGYGYSNDDENINRDEQHTLRFQASYILNDWIYTLRSGYITDTPQPGMTDTTLKIKKRFRPAKNFKFVVGAGVRLPTYDFPGNKTDFTLYSSAIYYPVSSLSLFGGANYTFINDTAMMDAPLQNITALYMGAGYFFTKELYANLSYSNSDTKFANSHKIKTLSSTLFYQVTPKWFISLTYRYELKDINRPHTFNVSVGYSVW